MSELYLLLDNLYSVGYSDHREQRDFDPRGCEAWQDVVEYFENHLVSVPSDETIILMRQRFEKLISEGRIDLDKIKAICTEDDYNLGPKADNE